MLSLPRKTRSRLNLLSGMQVSFVSLIVTAWMWFEFVVLSCSQILIDLIQSRNLKLSLRTACFNLSLTSWCNFGKLQPFERRPNT